MDFLKVKKELGISNIEYYVDNVYRTTDINLLNNKDLRFDSYTFYIYYFGDIIKFECNSKIKYDFKLVRILAEHYKQQLLEEDIKDILE